MIKTILEVGDKVTIKNWYFTMTVEIVRVTANKAISSNYNDAGAHYEFKRELCGTDVRPFKRDKYSVTSYKLNKIITL